MEKIDKRKNNGGKRPNSGRGKKYNCETVLLQKLIPKPLEQEIINEIELKAKSYENIS